MSRIHKIVLALCFLIILIVGGYWYWNTHRVSSTYRNEETGFTLAIPKLWNKIGYSVERSIDTDTGSIVFDFVLKGQDEHKASFNFSTASEITAVPLSQYPLSCEGKTLCQTGEEIGRNNEYVFVRKGISPEAYGVCTKGTPGFDQAFYNANTLLCDHHAEITYPEKRSGNFSTFSITPRNTHSSNVLRSATPQTPAMENKTDPSDVASMDFDLTQPVSISVIDADGKPFVYEYNQDRWAMKVLSDTSSKVLVSAYLRGSDSGTSILIIEKTSRKALKLGGFDNEEKALIYSPDKEKILIADESKIVLIDTRTLAYKTIFEPEVGTAYGTITDFPSFYPEVRWLTNSSIQVSIYPSGTHVAEPAPAPREVRTIPIP